MNLIGKLGRNHLKEWLDMEKRGKRINEVGDLPDFFSRNINFRRFFGRKRNFVNFSRIIKALLNGDSKVKIIKRV